MGSCSSSEKPTLFEVLETRLASDTEVQNFDDLMHKAEQTISEIEEVRFQIAQAWGRLLCQSGAIVQKFPKINSTLLGICYQVSRDFGHEVLKFISLKKEKPFLEELNHKSESCIHSSVECFHIFVSTTDNLKERAEGLKERIEIIDTKVEESKDSNIDAFKEKAGTLEEMRPLLEKLHSNRRKIKHSSKVISEMTILINSISQEVEILINKFVNREERLKLDSLFQNIYDQTSKAKDREQRFKSNTILFSKFSDEEKISWDEVKRQWYLIIGEDYKETGPLPPPKKDENSKSHSSKKLDRREHDRQGFFSKKKEAKKAEETIKKLNEQIEDLKKQLEEMKTQTQTLKTDVSIAKPVFIYSIKPFKSWNIQLGISFLIEAKPISFAIDYEAQLLLIVTDSQDLFLVKMESWEVQSKLRVKARAIHAISLCDGCNFIVIDTEGGINIVNHISMEINLVGQLAVPPNSVSYAYDGDLLFLTCHKSLVMFSVVNSCELTRRTHYFENLTLTKSFYIREWKLLIIGSEEGTVIIYDPYNNQIVDSYNEHEGCITDMVVIKYQGKLVIASTSTDKSIQLYSKDEKKVIKKMLLPQSKTECQANHLLYGYDEKTIFTTHNDGKLILNNYNTNCDLTEHVSKKISTSNEMITAAIFAVDRSKVIIGSVDGKVDVYQNV